MNALYNVARERFLTAEYSWLVEPIAAYVVSDSYVFDKTHQTLDSVPAAARLKKAPELLSSKTATDGIASAAPITFGPVTGEGIAKAVLFVQDTDGVLLWYGGSGFGFPFRPNGSEIVVRRDEYFGGFFQI